MKRFRFRDDRTSGINADGNKSPEYGHRGQCADDTGTGSFPPCPRLRIIAFITFTRVVHLVNSTVLKNIRVPPCSSANPSAVFDWIRGNLPYCRSHLLPFIPLLSILTFFLVPSQLQRFIIIQRIASSLVLSNYPRGS